MENSERVYTGQLFVKINPIDITNEVNQAKEELVELEKNFNEEKERIKENKSLTKRDILRIKEDYEYMRSVEEVSKMPTIITYGMEKFWSLSIQKECFLMLSNRQNEYDELIVSTFNSLDEINKYYRSLPDIINSEPFIGKKMCSEHYEATRRKMNLPNLTVYGLYELDNLAISCTIDERNKLMSIFPCVKSVPLPLKYEGDSIQELNDPGRILRLVYKQRYIG